MQHHGAALRAIDGDDELARALARDWREAEIGEPLRAMLAYAEKLTLRPQEMEEDDLAPLREAGLDDEGILHLCEVVAYFNFVNRTADGLGVGLEEDWPHPIIPIDGGDAGPGGREGDGGA